MTFEFEKQKAGFWDEYKGKTIALDVAFNERYRQYKSELRRLSESIARAEEQTGKQTKK